MLNRENYFSLENNMKYMSTSQFKSFMECEAMALAEVKGEWQRETTKSMLIGSFVDAHFEGTMDLFKAHNSDIFLKGTSKLKAEFAHAEFIIQRLERDSMFMKYMSGEKQVIKTGEIEGIPFKTRIDSYHPGKTIVDLKVMKDFEKIWKDGLFLSFVEFWGYDIQGAIYQAIEGNKLPFIIAGVTKEKEPDLAIIGIQQERLDFCLDIVKKNVRRFADLKKDIGEAIKCGKCDYCKSTKVLTNVISYEEFGK